MVFTALGLFADSRVSALWQQDALGALAFTALVLLSLKAPAELRLQAWICVGVATCFEIFASLIWGLYHYRLHNLPLYVPAGHGTVYLFGLMAAQTPLIQRHGRRVAYTVLAAATTWAVLGLTVLPLVNGRIDVQGALWLPYLAWFLLRSPRWPVFAGIFLMVAELEILGTSFGNWYWMPYAPWTHIPSGNPPSVVARQGSDAVFAEQLGEDVAMHVVDVEARLDGPEHPPQCAAAILVDEGVPVALDPALRAELGKRPNNAAMPVEDCPSRVEGQHLDVIHCPHPRKNPVISRCPAHARRAPGNCRRSA